MQGGDSGRGLSYSGTENTYWAYGFIVCLSPLEQKLHPVKSLLDLPLLPLWHRKQCRHITEWMGERPSAVPPCTEKGAFASMNCAREPEGGHGHWGHTSGWPDLAVVGAGDNPSLLGHHRCSLRSWQACWQGLLLSTTLSILPGPSPRSRPRIPRLPRQGCSSAPCPKAGSSASILSLLSPWGP